MKRQRIQKQKILFKGIETEEQYRDLVFVTKNNRPTQQFIVQEAIGAIVNRIRKEHPDYEMFSPHCLRERNAAKDITEDSRTWLLADDNGFVLSCDRGYTVYRDDEDGKGCVSSKVCSKCVVRLF